MHTGIWSDICLPLTKELRIDMARLEIPVSGWTCFRTANTMLGYANLSSRVDDATTRQEREVPMSLTLVNVGGVGLLARLGALLLVARSGGLLAGILLLGGLGGSGRGLGGRLLVGGLGGHFCGLD